MKTFRYLSLIALFATFLLAGLNAGRLFDIQPGRTETPTPVKPPSPELQVKSRPNQLQAEQHSVQELLLAASLKPVEAQTAETADNPEDLAPQNETPEQQPAVPATENAAQPLVQQNILIIGVDDLGSAAPKLEGIWLALYLTQMPEFTLMPIYPGVPAEDGKMRSQDYHLARLFRTDQAAFFAELEDRGVWWSGYYVVDRTALTEIARQVEQMVGEPADENIPQVGDVPLPWDDPQAAKSLQGSFAQALCSRAAHLSVDQIGELDDLFLLFSEHIHSNVPREQAAAELVGMLAGGTPIRCEFPTLAEANPSP